jgi:hypothetical protein
VANGSSTGEWKPEVEGWDKAVMRMPQLQSEYKNTPEIFFLCYSQAVDGVAVIKLNI